MELYKKDRKGDYMLPEQREKWEKLIDMGWDDVAEVWEDWCTEEAYTDEFKLRRKMGLLDGVGMDYDDEIME